VGEAAPVPESAPAGEARSVDGAGPGRDTTPVGRTSGGGDAGGRVLPPVSTGAAAALMVAAVVVAALISVTVARLIPYDEDDAIVESARPVPAEPAPADALQGVAPTVTFDQPSADGLPDDALGPWTIEAGGWAVEDGAARATDTGEDGALAVASAPSGATAAQVTIVDPQPGAGLVVSHRDAEHYIALQVGRTGDTVQLVEVDGRPLQPRVLITADLDSPEAPLVLAVRRRDDGYEAVANGTRLGRRTVDEDAPDPWRIGLVTGIPPTTTETTFDDLVVA